MDNSKQYNIQLKYIGQTVRQLRKQQGMTIEDFTGEAHINEKYISKIENGKNITLTTLFRLSEGLNMNASQLLALAEEMERKSK